MPVSQNLLRSARLTHLYFGVFIAPALLFFALSGALQTFNLHESEDGSTYHPPAWIVTLAQIHKDQTSVTRPPRPDPPPQPADAKPAVPAPTPPPAEPAPPTHKHNPLPLKIFFLLVSVGLFVSTLTGLTMAYTYQRNRRLITLLLLAGAVLPIALLFV